MISLNVEVVCSRNVELDELLGSLVIFGVWVVSFDRYLSVFEG